MKTPKAKSAKVKKDEQVTAPTEKKVGPFDYINSILRTKIDMIRESEEPDQSEKVFNAFLTNKALSFHVDTILYANEMNRRAYLPGAMQYAYHINSVRGMQRKHSWPKKATDDTIAVIQERYKVNPVRAKEILKIIGDEGVEKIKKTLVKGGTVK